ncbi:hypothetical protein [Hyphomicrobium sp. CS1GBMeth3]|uniref:hypothetical protein n=1 Tax=Hyphomicrobium sp. CS1GBMeth3 TaxID=1892845 RepID=UPI000AC88EA1|nr:hypothetical protein [Hyphomicrobium sp. CS1GBMeth3]
MSRLRIKPGPKGKFAQRVGSPAAKRTAVVRSVDAGVLRPTQQVAVAAYQDGEPLPWLVATQVRAISIPERLLARCETMPLTEAPVINGREASPNTLANFYNIVSTAAATGARSQAAASTSGLRKAELVADIFAAAYIFEALSYPWQTVLRLRCHAESLKDPTPGTAVPTVELALRATVAAAVSAKSKALGERHGTEAKARRAVLTSLEKRGLDLAWLFRRKKEDDDRVDQDRYERNLKDWHQDFKNRNAGSTGQESAQREYDYLTTLVRQSSAPEALCDEFCEFAIGFQAAIQ